MNETPTHEIQDQPPPVPNGGKPLWELVIDDMRARDLVGRQRYGTPLQANNGRNALVDAYQEILDLAVYLRQHLTEDWRERARAAEAERDQLRAAITEHHGQKADDRCVEDDDRLYAAAGLPRGDRRVGSKEEMLANCARFIERRCEGGGWPSYRELEAERDQLRERLRSLKEVPEGSLSTVEIEAVHAALVDVIDGWNQAAADEDRGPSNHSLCLTIYDDGSGKLGRRTFGIAEPEDWSDFNDAAGLIALLKDQGIEVV